MNVFGIVSGFFAAQPMSVSPGVEPAQAARESVDAGISPDGCSCGAAQRCDPFADIPMGLVPDGEWVAREDARLGRLARLSRKHGPREAALRVFARPGGMPPECRPETPDAVAPVSQTHADTPEPLSVSEAI